MTSLNRWQQVIYQMTKCYSGSSRLHLYRLNYQDLLNIARRKVARRGDLDIFRTYKKIDCGEAHEDLDNPRIETGGGDSQEMLRYLIEKIHNQTKTI